MIDIAYSARRSLIDYLNTSMLETVIGVLLLALTVLWVFFLADSADGKRNRIELEARLRAIEQLDGPFAPN